MPQLTAADVKRLLHLEPHPREGGFFARTFTSGERLAPNAFSPARYDGPRDTATAIYYLLEPGSFSEMHMLASDELFHHYIGDPVQMLQLHPDGSSTTHVLGADLFISQRPQITVRRGTWQGSRLLPLSNNQVTGSEVMGSEVTKSEGTNNEGTNNGGTHGFALLGCTVSPGFEYADYRSATRGELLSRWPGEAELIAALTRE